MNGFLKAGTALFTLGIGLLGAGTVLGAARPAPALTLCAALGILGVCAALPLFALGAPGQRRRGRAWGALPLAVTLLLSAAIAYIFFRPFFRG